MQPLTINAEWNNEATVWVATSQDVDGLAIEADTMDGLIERLKAVLQELTGFSDQSMPGNELPFMLVKSWPVIHYLSCP